MEWSCDKDKLYAGITDRDLFWYQDYEGDYVKNVGGYQGVRDTSIDPFCGRYSLRNPELFYRNNYEHPLVSGTGGIDIQIYNLVSFNSVSYTHLTLPTIYSV